MNTDKPVAKPATISICAKCDDRFGATLYDSAQKELGEHEGSVPGFFPGRHWGSYVMLDIDIETGRILNWVRPTMEELEIFTQEEA